MPLRRWAPKDANDSSLDRCTLICLQSQVSIGLHLFDALARWRLVCEAALLPLVAAVTYYRVQTIRGLPL